MDRLCNECFKTIKMSRRFSRLIREYERIYRGILSWIKIVVKIMCVRGIWYTGHQYCAENQYHQGLKVLKSGNYRITPKKPL
jgi:hypothetical protein